MSAPGSALPLPGPEVAVERLRAFLKRQAGVVIAPGREELIQSRLGPLLRERGWSSLDALVDGLSAGDPTLQDQVIDLLTTHETSFFRDPPVFAWLRAKGLPRLLAGRPRHAPLRVWSAACSTGQEALSVAIAVLEDQPGQAIEIVGTDISAPTVQQAAEARYTTLAVNRGLGAKQLLRWFVRDGAAHWVARPELRERCSFIQHNLVADPKPSGAFDLVLLRNVLIYFDDADRQRAIATVASALRPGGLLVLGTAEGLMPIDERILGLEREDNVGFRVRR